MQTLKTVILAATLLTSSALFAGSHNMEGMDHSNMNHEMQEASNMAYYNAMMTRDGYKVTMGSEKPLINGTNHMSVMISHDNKMVDDAKVKVKFFMPEMPGMPYMEYKTKAKFEDGKYRCDVNLSMHGTWQYQLKFKTKDGKVRMVKGSVNY